MKTVFLTILFCFCLLASFPQTPQAFKYQAAVRDNAGNILVNKTVTFRISILQGSVSGAPVYSELHAKLTNNLGLVDLEIGRGTSPSGSFSSINWEVSAYFLKVEMDPAGGTAFQTLGTSQLLSVPFALMAKEVESVPTDATLSGSGTDASPLKIGQQAASSGQVLKWNGTTWKPGTDLTGTTTTPAGSTGNVQFNNSGAFGGDAGLNWDNTKKRLGIGTNAPSASLNVIGDAVASGTVIAGEFQRNSTGNANLVPIAYGVISFNGSIISGTGNFTASYNSTFKCYEISINNEYFLFSGCSAVVTPLGGIDPSIAVINNVNGLLQVYLYQLSGTIRQANFSFVAYKL
jgi:hypothetical protein